MTDATGRPITHVASAGNFEVGYLTNDTFAGAAGDEISVHLHDKPFAH
jgi:hypothetical protein